MPSHNLWTVRPEVNLCILYKIYIVPKGTFYQHVLTLIPAWICNYTLRKVCVEITNPFPNLNSATFEVWEWIDNIILHIVMDVIGYTYWDESEAMLVKRVQMVARLVPISIYSFHCFFFIIVYLYIFYRAHRAPYKPKIKNQHTHKKSN